MKCGLITSGLVGAFSLALSTAVALAQPGHFGGSEHQQLSAAGNPLILIRGGGGGGHGGGFGGGGHGFGGGGSGFSSFGSGAIARPMTSAPHMATPPAPGVGLSGAHPAAGLPGGLLHQRMWVPDPGGATRSPAATTVTPPAMASRPQPMPSAAGTTLRNGSTSAATAAAAAALAISGVDTSPSPPPPDRVTPPSAIAAPLPELAPIPPLSPQLPTQFATGGVAQPNLALSPGGSSSVSPSASAPSAPGGGGKSLADCMGFWDRETHMSKAEWKAACVRTMQDYPTVLR